MIHVDRARVPPPDAAWMAEAGRLREEIFSVHKILQIPHQRFPRFGVKRESERIEELTLKVKPALAELFRDQCAFCESRTTDGHAAHVVHFRPRSGAVGLDGNRSPEYYAWLVVDWENLYLSCANCHRSRGARFPVRGERASWGARWPLHQEGALLLDPCVDHPQRHLIFSADGLVSAVPFDLLDAQERDRFGVPTRGQVTIDTFALNRPNLVEQRRDRAALLTSELKKKYPNPFRRLPLPREIAQELYGPDEPYLGMKLQLIEEWGRSHVVGDRPFAPGMRTRGLPKLSSAATSDEANRERAAVEQRAREEQFLGASVEVGSDAVVYRARTGYVERVEIVGLTVFRDLRIESLPDQFDSGSNAPWLMLLGENGSGKTSILRAIALALAGRRTLHGLQQGPLGTRLVDLFEDGGSVNVFLTSQREPIEVVRKGDSLEVSGEASGAKVFLRGYGPSRWFPQEGSAAPETDAFVRIESLFNPFVPLDAGEQALPTLDPSKWDDIAGTLERLLLLREGSVVPLRERGALTLQLGDGEPTPLRALSSGYEAMVAMTSDLAQMLYGRWGSLLDAEGIVLLDEIDAHLHPRWKMRVVESLRQAFPRVQFIASTHEPLCLRGLRAGEILVLHREGDAITAQRPMDDVGAMRVDQLLTSRFFGLRSTLDPKLEGELERYYTLLSRHESALKGDERAELAELRDSVGSRGILGSTRRDQLIYRIIDEFVAREPAFASEGERAEAERLTAEQVAAAWSLIPDLPEEPT